MTSHATHMHHKMPCCANDDDDASVASNETSTASAGDAAEAVLEITGMRCSACVKKVRTALVELDGVLNADVLLADATAMVQYDAQRTDVQTMRSALQEIGYPAHSTDPERIPAKVGLPAGWMKKRIAWAVGTALCVVGFYLGLITLTSDFTNALYEFGDYGGWVVALAVGLGFQVALFTHMRAVMAGARVKGAASGMAASGGMSGVAMAACCSHYLAAILPAIGLPFFSGAVASLAEYQTAFFAFGVLSNLLGLGYMVRLMKKNGIFAFGHG